MDKMNHIKALLKKIKEIHHCKATHLGSEDVKETLTGETVWEGVVHIFTTLDHPEAYHIYGWACQNDGQSKDREYITVPAKHPIDTPEKAVHAYIVSQTKN